MRRKLLLVLLAAFLIQIPVCGQGLAVPMQRTVTVVDEQDNIIYKENIHYSNVYKNPEIKVPVNNATSATTGATSEQHKPAPAISRAGGSGVRTVIKNASDLLGKPYVYEASGPRGFDCSGFTMHVFSSVGVNLPHNAQKQFARGDKVPRDKLETGDLVFFGYYGSADIRHVGIYLGNGEFIHASTKKGVIITAMDSSYYAGNYKGAARVLR
ncbi:MAG: C40 family peptidase [Firmicutes bacterium]|nr:C40 family peptidase [Bacillota bacterium]